MANHGTMSAFISNNTIDANGLVANSTGATHVRRV